jgi:hypothetical protein
MITAKLLLAIILGSSLATAQTKISGRAQCPEPPSEQHVIAVGDRPGHAYVLAKEACTWTSPLEIAGLKSKDHNGVNVSEIDGSKAAQQASGMGTMENGDRYYFRLRGTATVREQKLETNEGTWKFTGGTGKLKGIRGKGTYKCAPDRNNVNCDVEGEYSLASQ